MASDLLLYETSVFADSIIYKLPDTTSKDYREPIPSRNLTDCKVYIYWT